MKNVRVTAVMAAASIAFGGALTSSAQAHGLKSLATNYRLLDASIGLKNDAQLLFAMQVGLVEPSIPQSVQDYYDKIKANLPSQGRATEISPESLFAISGLALAFCVAKRTEEMQLAVDNRVIYKGFDLSSDGSALDRSRRITLSQTFANHFWGRDPDFTETTILSEGMQEIMAMAPGNVGMLAAVDSACASALSSFDFIRY